MKLPVENLSNASDSYSFKNRNPYNMSFVYGINGARKIIKGGIDDVESEIKNIGYPALVFSTFFHEGESRYHVGFENLPERFKAFFIKSRKSKEIVLYRDQKIVFKKNVRRFPRCFPQEIKEIILSS